MTSRKRLIAAGGDLRQKTAAEALSGEYDVFLTGFGSADAVLPDSADILLLPTPITKDGIRLYAPHAQKPILLESLTARLSAGAVILGGRMTAAERQMLREAGFSVQDYTESESFAERNAVPTAEGAIMLAMQTLPVTLHGLHCLILGAGRISRALQMRLKALGAEVTVAARRFPDLARSEGGLGKPLPIRRRHIMKEVSLRDD